MRIFEDINGKPSFKRTLSAYIFLFTVFFLAIILYADLFLQISPGTGTFSLLYFFMSIGASAAGLTLIEKKK